jgi:hypothetical protein
MEHFSLFCPTTFQRRRLATLVAFHHSFDPYIILARFSS